jgi:trimeric autotransporter adhesin
MAASGGTSYVWTPATGLNTTTGAYVVAAPATSTTYTITATSNGCTGTATKSIGVSPSFNLLGSNNQSVCQGNSTALTASGATSYYWSPNTYLNTSMGANVTSTPASSITYTVTGISGYCSKTKSIAVAVLPKPTLSTTTIPASCGGAPNGSVNLSVSGATGTLSYNWSNGATTQDLNNVSSGSYAVTVNMVGGCPNNTSTSVAGGSCGSPTQFVTPTVTMNSAALSWMTVPCAVKYKVLRACNQHIGQRFRSVARHGLPIPGAIVLQHRDD